MNETESTGIEKQNGESHEADTLKINRRSFLSSLGCGIGAGVLGGTIGTFGLPEIAEASLKSDSAAQRARAARDMRIRAANMAYKRRQPKIKANGEEEDYPYIANFSKCLPHNELGEVDSEAYKQLLKAVGGNRRMYEQLPLGGARKFVNPQCGIAYDLQGPDCHHMRIRPAPRIDSAENSAEMAELYWHALLRDVPFTEYNNNALAHQAAADLSRFSDFRGPKIAGQVTPGTLFRGNVRGSEIGPYMSQFMLRDIPYGAQVISQRQSTILPNVDFMTSYQNWLAVQRGINTAETDQIAPYLSYVKNGRDLSHFVHIDALYQAYLNACLILLGMNAPVDPGNPYADSNSAEGFCTFGNPHIQTLVTEVATRALKAQWFQKWFVHRRIRPEAFSGRVHNHIAGKAAYPINTEIFHSSAIPLIADHTRAQNGGLESTYLLPMAFPEGSPSHPSYGSGHATVAGACVTILKAWFDEDWVMPNPVVPNADGTALVPYTGPDAGALTVGNELNKVAYNVAIGRNFAGVHWRSDAEESLKLGEEVAIGILQEQALTYYEKFSFTFTKFDGKKIRIKGGGAKTV